MKKKLERHLQKCAAYDHLQLLKVIALSFHKETNTTLGIASEIGKHEAALTLGIALEQNRKSFDATETVGDSSKRIRIRCHTVFTDKRGINFGPLDLRGEWDSILYVLQDACLNVTEIWELRREVAETSFGYREQITRQKLANSGICRWASEKVISAVAPPQQRSIDYVEQAKQYSLMVEAMDSMNRSLSIAISQLEQCDSSNKFIQVLEQSHAVYKAFIDTRRTLTNTGYANIAAQFCGK